MFVLRLSVTFLSYSQGSDSTFAIFMHKKSIRLSKDINEKALKAFTTFRISMVRTFSLKLSRIWHKALKT